MAYSQSTSASFKERHAGVVVVALDYYLEILAERAQMFLASPWGNAQNFANVRQMWDAAQAARREALS